MQEGSSEDFSPKLPCRVLLAFPFPLILQLWASLQDLPALTETAATDPKYFLSSKRREAGLGWRPRSPEALPGDKGLGGPAHGCSTLPSQSVQSLVPVISVGKHPEGVQMHSQTE